MDNRVKAFVDGWAQEQEKREIKKKIVKKLGTRSDMVNVLSVVTDESGASLVKFTWARNCDEYLACISALGSMKLYRQV